VAVEVAWFAFQGRWVKPAADARLAGAGRGGVGAALRRDRRLRRHAAVLIFAQLLHAITFAAQHSACIAVHLAPFSGRLRSRGQALYTVLGYGASGVLGGVAGGAMSERSRLRRGLLGGQRRLRRRR
jgi:PPP family 3-phenylpropionic acid transporter